MSILRFAAAVTAALAQVDNCNIRELTELNPRLFRTIPKTDKCWYRDRLCLGKADPKAKNVTIRGKGELDLDLKVGQCRKDICPDLYFSVKGGLVYTDVNNSACHGWGTVFSSSYSYVYGSVSSGLGDVQRRFQAATYGEEPSDDALSLQELIMMSLRHQQSHKTPFSRDLGTEAATWMQIVTGKSDKCQKATADGWGNLKFTDHPYTTYNGVDVYMYLMELTNEPPVALTEQGFKPGDDVFDVCCPVGS